MARPSSPVTVPMIDRDDRTPLNLGSYPAPTFEEMVQIGRTLGLVGGVELLPPDVRLQLAGQTFVLPAECAEAMLNGMLLGYFASTPMEGGSSAVWR